LNVSNPNSNNENLELSIKYVFGGAKYFSFSIGQKF